MSCYVRFYFGGRVDPPESNQTATKQEPNNWGIAQGSKLQPCSKNPGLPGALIQLAVSDQRSFAKGPFFTNAADCFQTGRAVGEANRLRAKEGSINEAKRKRERGERLVNRGSAPSALPALPIEADR